MKMKTFFLILFSFMLSTLAFATDVNLYEQPKTDSKVVAKVDLEVGIIPIFSPKSSDWMKVADPRNGNVGWIKTDDLKNAGSPSFTFTQRITNGKPETYQFMQYKQPKQLTVEELQQIKNINEQQQVIQQSIQKAYEDMMNAMQRLYQFNMNMMGPMPEMVKPSQSAQPAQVKPVSGAPVTK